MSAPYQGQSNDPNVPGISGENSAGGYGIYGESSGLDAVRGISHSPQHAGVAGTNDSGGPGVVGISAQSNGVLGTSLSSAGAGVAGTNSSGGRGVYGESTGNEGVRGVGHSKDHGAVVGTNDGGGVGVYGESNTYEGVLGVSHSPQHAGIAGSNDGGGPAGYFVGNVVVTGDITLTNADCAEEFDIEASGNVEPGTVMVLSPQGALEPSQQAYDKRVAGVISGAGDFKPGLILDKQEELGKRMPVALVGKVYCKVDAQYAPIEVGDLLTTSPTSGYAMKAEDPAKAFGAVIGKALRPVQAGQSLIPILIALQ